MTDRSAREDVEESGEDASIRLWLVERTFSDDELNIIILVYATPDGRQYLKKELSISGAGDRRDVTAAIEVDPNDVAPVDDPETRKTYARQAKQVRSEHDPGDAI